MTTTTSNQEENHTNPVEELAAQESMTMEQLFAEQDEFRKQLSGREIVKVKVVQVDREFVLVDIGEKKEGIIPVSDFLGPKNLPAVGSEVAAILEKRGGEDRHAVLSHRRAAEAQGWVLCDEAFNGKVRVKGTIVQAVKGGYIVEVFGIRGFMPLSLSEMHPAYKHHLPEGAKIRCQIIEFAKEKNRLIVSRKSVLEEDEQSRRGDVLSEIKEGEVLRVVVSKTSKDTVFLRFHGIEGFVSYDNVAWKDAEAAIAKYRRGQRLRAKLLKLDAETPRLEFGLKQLYPNPADILRRKFAPRTTVKCKVLDITDEGIRVSITPEVEGFISVEDYSGDSEPAVGDNISAVVVGVNYKTFRITLSSKRYETMQNRKIVAQYLREAPAVTLGDLLKSNNNNK